MSSLDWSGEGEEKVIRTSVIPSTRELSWLGRAFIEEEIDRSSSVLARICLDVKGSLVC